MLYASRGTDPARIAARVVSGTGFGLLIIEKAFRTIRISTGKRIRSFQSTGIKYSYNKKSQSA